MACRSKIAVLFCVGPFWVGLLDAGRLVGQVSSRPIVGAQKPVSTTDGTKVVAVPADEMEQNLIDKVLPTEYPPAAQSKGVAGTVTMAATIGTDGLVKSLTVVSGPEELQASALAAARQWKFHPYVLHGETHEVTTTLLIKFELGT
jgi:TonB family protein